jgi:hypothetical protein
MKKNVASEVDLDGTVPVKPSASQSSNISRHSACLCKLRNV